MAAQEDELVRRVTEKVTAQMQAQITAMQQRIAKLEAKVEEETRKRVQAEEEMRRLASSPSYPTQKVFLRNYAMQGGQERGAGDSISENGTRKERTQSDAAALHGGTSPRHHSDLIFSPPPNSQPIPTFTQPKQSTTPPDTNSAKVCKRKKRKIKKK